MDHYIAELVVRRVNSLVERTIKANIVAANELHARRIILERAWSHRLVVVRFLSIKPRAA